MESVGIIPLLRKGYDVTGFDFSQDMVKVLQKKCEEEQLDIGVLQSSFEDFRSDNSYTRIFIPEGFFGFLTDQARVHFALNKIFQLLNEIGMSFGNMEFFQKSN